MHLIPILDPRIFWVVVVLIFTTLMSGIFGLWRRLEGVYGESLKKYQAVVAVISWIMILALLVMLFLDDPFTAIGFIVFIASIIINWEAVQSWIKHRLFKKSGKNLEK